MLFGFDQKMSGLEWMNNQSALPQLYTPEFEAFLYGVDAGTVSLEYTMGNSYWLTAILNNPVTETGTGPYTRTWSSDPDATGTTALNNTRIPKTQELEIGFALIENTTTSNPEVRNAKGVVTQSINLKTSIDNPVVLNETLIWGIESTGTTLSSSIPNNSDFSPMNFVNSRIQLDYSGGLETLVKIQDVEYTFARNSELLREINTSAAVDAYTKTVEMTGKVTLAFDNADAYDAVTGRAELASMELLITNGQYGTDERSLTLTFSGVGLSKLSLPDIQPGEPIFQEFEFQCRTISAVAVDNTATFAWT